MGVRDWDRDALDEARESWRDDMRWADRDAERHARGGWDDGPTRAEIVCDCHGKVICPFERRELPDDDPLMQALNESIRKRRERDALGPDGVR